MKPADLLVEIGTEELPPKALRGLMDAFADHLGAAIDDARLLTVRSMPMPVRDDSPCWSKILNTRRKTMKCNTRARPCQLPSTITASQQRPVSNLL